MARMGSLTMDRTDTEGKLLVDTQQESQMVKCDICGRHYNQRYLTSHKRLSHNMKGDAVLIDEGKAVETILALYKKISAEARTDLLRRLSAAADEA